MFKQVDLGLLVLRLGFGASMALFHGWGKITAPEKWEMIGGNMSRFGISFAPQFWGFMAAFSEFGAAILIMLGIFFRPATAMLAFTMLVAVMVHLGMEPGTPNAGWRGASHALELMIVCLALFCTGPGRYALVIKKSSNE